MSALSPTLPPRATSALYPSDPCRAGVYSSMLTHFATERDVCGAELIPYGCAGSWRRTGEYVCVIGSDVREQWHFARARRPPFLFHLSRFDWTHISPPL